MDWDKILDEQAKDPGFAPVPAGKYPVRVEKAEAVKASTGNDMINITLVIEGGPYDTKKVFTRIVFALTSSTAMRFTLRKLAALGVTREVIAAQKPSVEQIASMLVGAKVEAEVEVRPATPEYDASNDVKSFRKLGESNVAGAGANVPPIPVPTAEPPLPSPAPAPVADVPAPDEDEPF